MPQERQRYLSQLSTTTGAGAVAVQDYHRFLSQLRHSAAPQAPSPLTDLLWHTHMQHPVRYSADCLRLAGRLIDHDDDL